jgi:hypothetical protein
VEEVYRLGFFEENLDKLGVEEFDSFFPKEVHNLIDSDDSALDLPRFSYSEGKFQKG